MVLNVHRACGLGMILKLFSTLDLSLLAQAKYIGKRNIKKIAIRGDGKSPDQKVIDMQLQAANLVYIFNNVVLWML